MKKDKLDCIGFIDEKLIEKADGFSAVKGSSRLVRWGAAAACLCLIAVVCAVFWHFGENPSVPEFTLSDKTTAKVSYGYGDYTPSRSELVYLTEQEMFENDNLRFFRGKVLDLTNVTIDFNGEKLYRCVASIKVDKSYDGTFPEGETVTVLLPCPIDTDGLRIEDTGIISQLKKGMEGIFTPRIYDSASYIEMNGAVLMCRDLADCVLLDGMRWVFLTTDRGLLFEKNAYPGAKNAKDLDDVEAYVIKMLESTER